MGTETRTDIYRTITDRIIAAIEAGTETLRMPWHASGDEAPALPVNIASGKTYRGINTLALWCAGQAAGYGSGLWGTYRQWQEIGAQVRKGEKASPVVFWKTLDREESEDPGETAAGRRFVARGYAVFNADQVDGLALPQSPAPAETSRIAHAERFFEGLGLTLAHGGNRAFYSSACDRIQLPLFSAFPEAEGYYATLAHETIHWTGHASRCDRQLGNRFGTDAYAAEELIAELGAAYLCADLALSTEPRPDHAAYIESWLRVLRGDTRAIFTAAAKAQQAADWIHANQTDVHAEKSA